MTLANPKEEHHLNKPTAMRIFAALQRFAETGEGDVKALQGRDELRLRVGDYRLFLVALAVLALCAVAASAEAGGKSAVGTWKLDASQSSYGTLPAPKFEQLVVTTDTPKALAWKLTGSSASGRSYSSSFDGPIDGQYHPIVSSEGENSVAYTRTPSGGVKWSIKDKSGNVFETGSSHLSADGNTLTFRGTVQGAKGSTDFVSVFTKTQ